MKRKSLFLCLLALFVVSCSDSETEESNSGSQAVITVPTAFTNLQFDSSASNQTITFTATKSWSLSISEITKASPDWVEISPMSGDAGDAVLSIKLSENMTGEDRSAYITIISGSYERELVVTQAEFVPTLSIDKTSQSVTCDEGSFSIAITSNSDWSITNSSTWISLSPTQGSGDQTLTVNYTENKTYNERSDTFTISVEGVTQTFTLTQAGEIFVGSLSLSTNSESVAKESGSFTINVISNTDWSISNASSWISVSPTQGSGNQTITVTYDANTSYDERSDTFTISAEGIDQIVTINQASEIFTPSLTLDKNDISIDCAAGSLTISITSNIGWSLTNSADWITLNPTSGSGDQTITVTYSANASTEKRSTSITIKATDYDITQTISITQAADLSVDLTDSDITNWDDDDSDDDGGISANKK